MNKLIQPETDARNVTFMALEVGAQWPEGFEPRGENAPDGVVIAQQQGEPPAEFVARVKHKLESLLEHGQRIHTAVLATSSTFEFAILESRCSVAHALLKSLDAESGAELVLTSTDDPLPENRAHLFALAGALGESINFSVGIRVRFGALDQRSSEDYATKSGVYPTLRPLVAVNNAAQ